MTADEILAKLTQGEGDGKLENELLIEINLGFRMGSIVELLESGNQAASSSGVFLLEELVSKALPIKGAALKLFDSVDAWRREVCLKFISQNRIFDEETIPIIRKGLADYNVVARCWAINCIAKADENCTVGFIRYFFSDASAAVLKEIGSGRIFLERDRAKRALVAAIFLKIGICVLEIERRVLLEDSYTFEFLDRLQKYHPVKYTPFSNYELR